MILLSQITGQLQNPEVFGESEIMVKEITMDSGMVGSGSCFVAIKGTKTDGHLYIHDAVEKGASVIVCEHLPQVLSEGVTYLRVVDTASALGYLASAFYHNPSDEITLIGITGTNGKTTIATLLYEAFTRLGYRCGLLSTIRYCTADEESPASHTTPDAIKLQRLLRRMVDEGCEYCFMEVSSHAVVQKRIAGLTFAGGIFTNLTHDHLDYHPTFIDYLKAKQTFFHSLPASAFALTSKDDPNGKVMVQTTRAKVFTYSTSALADYHSRIIENTIDGMQMELGGKRVWIRLTGTFNARNITAVYAAASILEADESELLEVLSTLEPVEGRFQVFRGVGRINAIVDYAHTPDALQNVLETIREVNQDEGRIITVLGAGGDRDPFKRPLMAGIAVKLSDKVILTSDNPRTEDPLRILEEMNQGVDAASAAKILTIPDRREAIKTAVMLAKPNTIILIAGKGHEKYQEINGVKYPFDDMEVVKLFINNTLQHQI